MERGLMASEDHFVREAKVTLSIVEWAQDSRVLRTDLEYPSPVVFCSDLLGSSTRQSDSGFTASSAQYRECDSFPWQRRCRFEFRSIVYAYVFRKYILILHDLF